MKNTNKSKVLNDNSWESICVECENKGGEIEKREKDGGLGNQNCNFGGWKRRKKEGGLFPAANEARIAVG